MGGQQGKEKQYVNRDQRRKPRNYSSTAFDTASFAEGILFSIMFSETFDTA